MSYAIEWKPSARKEVRRLDVAVRRRVLDAIGALAADPRPVGSVTLAGSPGWRRIRIGGYRVVYEIRDDALVVLVLRVGGRGGVYRHLRDCPSISSTGTAIYFQSPSSSRSTTSPRPARSATRSINTRADAACMSVPGHIRSPSTPSGPRAPSTRRCPLREYRAAEALLPLLVEREVVYV